MSISVNPPPMFKVPKALQGDKDVATYFRHLDRMLLQLWKRTGGGKDLIDFSAIGEDNNKQIAHLFALLNQLKADFITFESDVDRTIDITSLTDRLQALETEINHTVDLTEVTNRLQTLEDDVITPFKLPETGVVAGSYTNANLTIDVEGRVTLASNNASGVLIGDSPTWTGTHNFSQGSIGVGVSDTTRGTVTVFGDNATSGGRLDLYNGATDDGVADYWRLMAEGGDYVIKAADGLGGLETAMSITAADLRTDFEGVVDFNGGAAFIRSATQPYLYLNDQTASNTGYAYLTKNGANLVIASGALNGALGAASDGNIFLEGLSGGNVVDLRVKSSGSYQDIYHDANADTKITALGYVKASGVALGDSPTWTGTHTWTQNATFAGDIAVNGGSAEVGVANTARGTIYAYGNSATAGGQVLLYNGGTADTEVDYWGVRTSSSGELLLQGAGGTSGTLNALTINTSGAATFSQNPTISRTGATSALSIDADGSGTAAWVTIRTSGSARWQLGKTSEAESGSDAGSNLGLRRYSDAGALIDTPLSINRASGDVSVANQLRVDGELRVAGGNAPATATTAGETGEIRWDTSYMYVCTAANVWKRTLLSTW